MHRALMLSFLIVMFSARALAAEPSSDLDMSPSKPGLPKSEPIGSGYPTKVIPPRILEGASAQLVARVGREFYERYVSLDSSRCSYWRGYVRDSSLVTYTKRGLLAFTTHWTLTYKLEILEKPWVSGPIEVYVDNEGAPIAGAAIDGIGDCTTNPEECWFRINAERAIQLARAAGLESGIRPWMASLVWKERPEQRHMWQVTNTISIAANGCSSHGRSALIDASSGRFIGMEDFDIDCDPKRR